MAGRKINDTTKIISAFMSKQYSCMTLDELQYLTKLKRNKLIRLLHELYKKGYIHRHWRYYKKGKERIYCLYKEKVLEKS